MRDGDSLTPTLSHSLSLSLPLSLSHSLASSLRWVEKHLISQDCRSFWRHCRDEGGAFGASANDVSWCFLAPVPMTALVSDSVFGTA